MSNRSQVYQIAMPDGVKLSAAVWSLDVENHMKVMVNFASDFC